MIFLHILLLGCCNSGSPHSRQKSGSQHRSQRLVDSIRRGRLQRHLLREHGHQAPQMDQQGKMEWVGHFLKQVLVFNHKVTVESIYFFHDPLIVTAEFILIFNIKIF